MRISVGKTATTKVAFSSVEIKSAEELTKIMLGELPYSLGVFKDDYRNKKNFIQAESIGLDFDGKYTLEQAKVDFANYKHVIATTRSHQIEKNGEVCDRFRVILFLTEPIKDENTFYATWFALQSKFSETDPACKDPSRYWFPSKAIVSVNMKGDKVAPTVSKVETNEPVKGLVESSPLIKGKLANTTLRFMAEGAPKGDRHRSLFRAATDYREQGYTQDEFTRDLEAMVEKCNGIMWPDKGHADTVNDVFNNREPKYEPRIQETAFKLRKIGDLYKDKTKIEWIVDDLLTAGGISLMSSDPKAGKSTLVRQLMREVLRGNQFLTRRCKKGAVHYYAIEEQVEVLNTSFQRLGITPDEELYVHVGDALTDSKMPDFETLLMTHRPLLAVIDTMFDFLDVESENNYREVKRELRKLRKIARASGTHILLVHHSSKAGKDDKRRGNRSILGSQAIAGGVDTIMVIEVEGRNRLISTTGREIHIWQNRRLVYDKNTCTYTLGPEDTNEEF